VSTGEEHLPLIDVDGIRKTYTVGDQSVLALANISMRVKVGEFIAVLGRSGSGKSTLMSVLGLLERPDAGRYLLRGRDVQLLNEDSRAHIRSREIGFIFQFPALLPRSTAVENVELPLTYARVGRQERRHRAEAALKQVGLGDRLDHGPTQLSGGEQQRVAIARALVNNPLLIFADEPTGALDSSTENSILSILDEINRHGQTIIVVTHAAEVAARARRQIILHDGQIVADQTAINQSAATATSRS
jgi:putative ABC transport system ATP-binding protein